MNVSDAISNLTNERFISLCTFKKNGEKVETPVIFGIHNTEIIISTKTFAGKLKRIKNNSKIVFYPCNSRGFRKGSDHDGIARLLDKKDEQYAYNILKKKNGLIFRLWRLSGKLQRHNFVFILITPVN